MKKLSKKQSELLAALTEELQEKRQVVSDAFDGLDSAVGDYNGVVAELNELFTDVHDSIESYYGDRSEKWQESETGEAYQAWMDEWEQAIEEIEISQPEWCEDEEIHALADLSQAPQEC